MKRNMLALMLYLVTQLATAQTATLGTFGFDTSFQELLLLERLNFSVRFDSESRIESEWNTSYDHISVQVIDSVQNRYGLFVNDTLQRADIAIRGTVNLMNVILVLRHEKNRNAVLGINLHSGFEKTALALYADLRPRLDADYTIRISGHSLGAAEAIIVGMLLVHDGYTVEKIIASAPPKVTDAEGWALSPDTLPIIRFANVLDPIPFFPSRSTAYDSDPYIQGGDILLLLEGPHFTVKESSFYADLPAEKEAIEATGYDFGATDHFMKQYMTRLRAKTSYSVFVFPGVWTRYASPTDK
jgi:hypothetical protein